MLVLLLRRFVAFFVARTFTSCHYLSTVADGLLETVVKFLKNVIFISEKGVDNCLMLIYIASMEYDTKPRQFIGDWHRRHLCELPLLIQPEQYISVH